MNYSLPLSDVNAIVVRHALTTFSGWTGAAAELLKDAPANTGILERDGVHVAFKTEDGEILGLYLENGLEAEYSILDSYDFCPSAWIDLERDENGVAFGGYWDSSYENTDACAASLRQPYFVALAINYERATA